MYYVEANTQCGLGHLTRKGDRTGFQKGNVLFVVKQLGYLSLSHRSAANQSINPSFAYSTDFPPAAPPLAQRSTPPHHSAIPETFTLPHTCFRWSPPLPEAPSALSQLVQKANYLLTFRCLSWLVPQATTTSQSIYSKVPNRGTGSVASYPSRSEVKRGHLPSSSTKQV